MYAPLVYGVIKNAETCGSPNHGRDHREAQHKSDGERERVVGEQRVLQETLG
jgi:hypothetical protein